MRSPDRLKPALVRGQRAKFWMRSGQHLVIFHPRGTDETDVPIMHLTDEIAMAEHYTRLAMKDWIEPDAIAELAQIAEAAA